MPVETKAILETRLSEINSAIHAILVTGQSYGRPGHNKSNASLSDLYKAKADTEKRLRILDGGSGFSVMEVKGGGSQSESSDWGDD